VVDPSDFPRLLKRLYRFRQEQRATRRHGLARLLRPRRKTALVAALRRDWPGGYAPTDQGNLVFVPAPLDARGEDLLFYGFDAPAPALAFVPLGGVAIDVGANLGEWAVPLAQAVGSRGRVLCCEPNPMIAAALARTLNINNLAYAEVWPVAISDSDDHGYLAIDTADTGRSHLAASGIAVKLRSLDSIAAEAMLDRVDLVKIDVEGHEAAVLAGGKQMLQRFRPALIFESGHETTDDRAAIADLLDELAYDIVAALHHLGAGAASSGDYRAAQGACAPGVRNLLALQRPVSPAAPGRTARGSRRSGATSRSFHRQAG
jgi:FkbM family methyltransferase